MKNEKTRKSGRWYGVTAGWLTLWLGLCFVQLDVLAGEEKLPLKNTDMEEGNAVPALWEKGQPVAGVELIWDRTTAHSGKASLCLKKTAQRYFPIAQWSQSVPVKAVNKARKLRVRCWVKAQDVTKVIIDVNYKAEEAGHAWAVYLGQKKAGDLVATHDWKLCEGFVEVPANTSDVGIAFQIYGPGTVWFDDLDVAWVE